MTLASGNRVRVLFVHAADEMYGSDLVLLAIVRRLGVLGVDARVELPNDLAFSGLLGDALQAHGVPVRRSRLAVLRRRYHSVRGVLGFASALVRSSLRLARTIRAERIDVVHSHTAAVFSGALAALLTRRPHVWHVSEIVERPRAVRRILGAVIPAVSRRVVAVSHAVARAMRAGDDPRWSVVHNGFDADAFAPPSHSRVAMRASVRAELGLGDDVVLVAMIGRVGTWKGQELLLDAFARVRHHERLHLLLAGGPVDDDQAALTALRDRAARAAGVRATVWDYRADVAAIMAAADLFVQPSSRPDPFPTTVLEAMACGLPVVATDHGGHGELVADGETGLLVPPGDAVAMAAAIDRLARDGALRRALGDAGARRVRERFPAEGFAERYATIYRELAGR